MGKEPKNKTFEKSMTTAQKPKKSTDSLSNINQESVTNSEISKLDKAKLRFEEDKILLEREKLDFERNKFSVSLLIEDFKARWQELLNFENENSRWQTLYVTALILVISWVLNNSGEAGKYKKIGEIFNNENSFLLLSLALINAIYTLAMAYKGYQIQEIAQYLYNNVSKNINKNINNVITDKISDKISVEFNSWEKWRRDEKGSPTFIRSVFYITIGFLPTAVSATILFLYFEYQYSKQNIWDWNNIFFYFVTIFVLMSLITALSTTTMNKRWNEILASKAKDMN